MYTLYRMYLHLCSLSPVGSTGHVGHGTVDIALMLLKLILIRDGSLYVDLPCFGHDVSLLISHLSATFTLLYFRLRFHNKY